MVFEGPTEELLIQNGPNVSLFGRIFPHTVSLAEWHAPPEVAGNEITLARACER